jgi:alkylhydroperoxidase family enzyme
MARIPYLDPQTAPESVRRLLAPDRPQNIALLFGHAETNWPRLADLLLSILGEQALPGRLRELAILRVASLRAAGYEWDQHVTIASAAGVGAEQIAAIERGAADAACFGALERVVLRATSELVEQGSVSEATLGELSRRLSPREMVELLLAGAVYEALAKLMNTLALDREGSPTAAFAEAVVRGNVARAARPPG